jgi:putative FmdB family regulatory protein
MHMPIYEYLCVDCNNKFEKLQTLSSPPVGECPKCGGNVNKVFSVPSLKFNGAGFYKTDYAPSSSDPVPPPKPDGG